MAVRGAPLTDARIRKYILAGRYGEERRAALLSDEAAKPKRSPSAWSKTLALLQ